MEDVAKGMPPNTLGLSQISKAVMQVGKKNRSVGATLMNQDSSRSHSIFTITVEKLQQGEGQVLKPLQLWTMSKADKSASATVSTQCHWLRAHEL